MNRKRLENTATLVLGITIMVFFCSEFILDLTPPISRDALIHHLAVPKLWLKNGGFYEIPWADYSYYPMNINLLYLVCLYFKNDIAPKFIHLGFGLGTGWLVYIYLQHRCNRNWGLLGMIIFFTTPIVVWLSTSAYIDLGMTFFTTASVLAFIRWQDSAYNQITWLLISSICMGLAIGSKYNALIAFLILNLMVMYSYAHDTKMQMAAVKYGLIFFAVAVLIVSPWYLKNFLQTGNPFYPLFNSLFQSINHTPVQEILHKEATQKIGSLGFFQMREVMYGESFWETLLIPLRMFFQGEDDSYRYFQGVLNPILILFLPFILLNKENKKDKFVFILFSVFFIIMAYFLTEKQVRYILPVLPFLSIIAVMGIKNLDDKLKPETCFSFLRFRKRFGSLIRILLFATIAILLTFNLTYLKKRFDIIKPFPYILNQETRDDFLRRHLLHYDAVKYINANLPMNAKVFTVFLGRRGYYLDREYKNEPSFGRDTISQMVNSSISEEKFQKYVRSMNVTHILMRTDLADNYLKDNFSIEEIERFMNLVKKHWKLIYESNDYTIWKL
jgi:hypothetical protein